MVALTKPYQIHHWLYAWFVLVLVTAMSACSGAHRYTEYDRQGIEESHECVKPPDIEPPPGTYENQGLDLDWDRLVHPEDPMSRDIDMRYALQVSEDPEKLEQVYYAATHEHARASFLACQYEVGARVVGRNAARHLTSFECRAILTCDFKAEKLPFSEDTASGERLLTFIAQAFEREAEKQGAFDQLIGYFMPRLAGGKAAKRVRTRGPLFIPRRSGPGRWVKVNESMSARARAYQERITQRSSKKAYEVDGVKFDGYRKGVLLEAKGPGYAKFIRDGKFRPFFKGEQSLIRQARHQADVAKGTPIEWHVAEHEFAAALRRTLSRARIGGIRIIHTP